jgi:hypothetical protein
MVIIDIASGSRRSMVSVARTAATITVRFRTAPNVDVSSVALADAAQRLFVNVWTLRSAGSAGFSV